MSAYSVVLFVHSWLRWVVLVLAIVVFVQAIAVAERGPAQVRLHRILLGSVDLQLLLGLALYIFLSPTTAAFFAGPGAAMKVPVLRFFGIEHIFGMVLGVALLHSAPPKRGPSRKRVLWTVGVFLVLVLASMPWPFVAAARPLFRGV